MPHPASRVLAMLELLQSRQRVTGADLAAALRVDERTVRRYATTLSTLGIPVTANRGRYGGYQLSPGKRIPPLMLTDNEALAVVLGLAVADQLGLAAEAPATAVALGKVHRVLPDRLAPRLAAVQETVGFSLQPRAVGARPGSAMLLTLGAATRQRRRVTMSYRAGASDRLCEVDPYGLVFHSGRWYVVGPEHPAGQIGVYELGRIGAVDVGETTFSVPDGFDARGHVDRTRGERVQTWPIEVLLETDLVDAQRRLHDADELSGTAELTETADGILLRARVASLGAAATLLAGLGCPFAVVGPRQLRTAVVEHAEQLLRYARRP